MIIRTANEEENSLTIDEELKKKFSEMAKRRIDEDDVQNILAKNKNEQNVKQELLAKKKNEEKKIIMQALD